MAKQYGKRKEISSSVFMLLRAPKVYKMTSYNTPAGGSYNQLKTFWEKDCDDVLEFAKDLDTSIGIYQADGRLYLVRNLVDSATYRPWGVLVHRLNLNYCFESLLHFYDNANVKIVLDGKNIVTQGNAEIWKDAPEAEKKGSAVYTVKDKIMVDSFSLPVGELFTTANYKMAFERLGIATAYRNSMIISGTVALAVILLAGMASFALVRYQFKIRGFLMSLVVAGMMFPVFSTIIPVYQLENRMGITATNSLFLNLLCVILPQIAGNLSFAIVVLTGYIKSLPIELEEAAYMEGSNAFQTFFKVVVPLTKPSFATVAIFSFLWSYNDLFTQMFFLRNKKFWAITRLMQMLTSKEGTNYGLMASTVSLVVIPVIIVYIFLQKYIIKGMTAGAVKG